MKSKAELREIVRTKLPEICDGVNQALTGKSLSELKPVLTRIGRDQKTPHWFNKLRQSGTLPNVDGKTVGSVLEMVFVAVIETGVLRSEGVQLRINPARGVDLPDLELGIKSPSKNYCTSEPFFSAYERLYGITHDVAVLLTNYQTAKKIKPLRLAIIDVRYLKGSEVADVGLCNTARAYRDILIRQDEFWAQKFFKFLAYVNQSDWLAKQLLNFFVCFTAPEEVHELFKQAEADFNKKVKESSSAGEIPIDEEDLNQLRRITTAKPVSLAIVDAIDRWVERTFQEAARNPNATEWQRLKSSPLDGKIGISPALQWRYNFGRLFKAPIQSNVDADDGDGDACAPEEQ